jgi:hypothetical protein
MIAPPVELGTLATILYREEQSLFLMALLQSMQGRFVAAERPNLIIDGCGFAALRSIRG